jgi:site-specific DNA-methyltransferase (adenine-specific)
MNIIYKPISELIPYVNNPRKNDKAVDAVASSIKNYGFRQPIVIDGKNEIIIGHTRLLAAKKLKMEMVPCAIVDDLTPQQIKGLRIADNKVAEYSEWDMDLLKIELDGLDEFTGFEIDELDIMFEDEKEIIEDEVPEVQEEVITKLGDLYEIGEHRLLCGDSTDGEQVARLMNREKAELLLTDPPYGIGIDGQKESKAKNPKHNRKKHEFRGWDNKRPEQNTFNLILSFAQKAIIWGGNYFSDLLPASRGWIYWSKGQDGLTMSDGELAWTSENKPLRSVTVNRAVLQGSSHPTQKPIEVISFCIKWADFPNIILDTFLGSGSTMVASHQLKRKCYGMELDPKYCDVIIRRMINLDPDITIKRNGIECKQEFRK